MRSFRNDGNQVRRALLDMYEDQAMDNLIRAHENLPFVQLNYHDVLVQADEYTGTFTSGQSYASSASRSLNCNGGDWNTRSGPR